MPHIWIVLGAVNGFLAVALGAFGAHGLAQTLQANDRVATWETAVNYHMYHALAMFAVAWLVSQTTTSIVPAAGWCFLLGIVIFSGSLYALSITNITRLGAITPIGGVLFLIGWVLLAVAGWKMKAV
jgi:uncharacterized membrane protein YgdD (TMEM256/DUF423 family)